jgi:general stress protein CsbA
VLCHSVSVREGSIRRESYVAVAVALALAAASLIDDPVDAVFVLSLDMAGQARGMKLVLNSLRVCVFGLLRSHWSGARPLKY